MPNLSRVGIAVGVAGLVCWSEPARAETPPEPAKVEPRGLFGPMRVGALVGIGVPDGLRLDLAMRYRKIVSIGVAGTYLPEIEVPGADASLVRVGGEGWIRVHPFRGKLFAGVAGGYARMKGSMTQSEVLFRQSTSAAAHAYASVAYVTPELGMMWSLPFGVTAGFDIGVQIPVASTGPTFDASKYGLTSAVEGKGSAADAMRAATKMPIPMVHVLELGVML